MPQILVAIVPGKTLLGGLKRIGILVDAYESSGFGKFPADM